MIKITKYFEWRLLTPDGYLQTVPCMGLKQGRGIIKGQFKTEKDAMDALKRFIPYTDSGEIKNLVLVPLYKGKL